MTVIAEPASQDGYRVLGPSRQVWLPTLAMMIPPTSDGLRILELDTDPNGGRTATQLAHRGGPGSVVVSVSEDAAVTEWARAACGQPDRFEFHTGPLEQGWADGGPYDVVISLWKLRRVPYAWLRQCAPDAVLLCPVSLVRSVRRTALMGMFLIDGLITWPQLMFVADGTGAWVTHGGGAILTAQDKVGYTVRLNPDADAGDPDDAVRPNEYRDVTLVRWVTTINPDRPAHLVPVEYPTRGIAWTGLGGGRFNAGGYAGASHRPRCTACLLIYDSPMPGGRHRRRRWSGPAMTAQFDPYAGLPPETRYADSVRAWSRCT